MNKSLKASGSQVADQNYQIRVLNGEVFQNGHIPHFKEKLNETGEYTLKPTGIEIFQVNVGYMCNQTCKHCHVDAGPDRKEIMTTETMEDCLKILDKYDIPTLDITGGVPEMNPHFRWFVEESKKRGVKEIIVRSNLTIILANKKYHDLPWFFKEHGIRIVSSLPYYRAGKTDRQRGKGVFDKSITALQMLNNAGYGKENSGLALDLVYNPTGAFLPGNQEELKKDFKEVLYREHGIVFNNLMTITNLPISRFLDYLIASGNYEDYMEKLVEAYNPGTVESVMCRDTISVDWKGYLYDCDFNQMLGIKVENTSPQHISEFDLDTLNQRTIMTGRHCFGCTAGSGSGCQGALT